MDIGRIHEQALKLLSLDERKAVDRYHRLVAALSNAYLTGEADTIRAFSTARVDPVPQEEPMSVGKDETKKDA